MPIVDREWAVAREEMSVFSKAVNMCGKEMEIVTKAANNKGSTPLKSGLLSCSHRPKNSMVVLERIQFFKKRIGMELVLTRLEEI